MLSENFPAQLAGFREGSLLAGYRLEALVGRGGMAAVYRARDESLGRSVALKILVPDSASDSASESEFRTRFIAESRAAARADDPHIIPVYEAGEADGVLYIAMRFVAGGDLGQVLKREGALSPDRAAEFISPVASALDAAHSIGLVHRDVKPGNILVDARPGRPDHVYLSDFGVVKGAMSATNVTATGHYVGTPDYIAPEQFDGRDVDGRADQYALACVTYELLTGVVPFERNTVMAVLVAHTSEPPPSLRSRRPDLPDDVGQVLAKAMAKAPEKRYGSCGDFADALRDALGLLPYHPRRSGTALAHSPPPASPPSEVAPPDPVAPDPVAPDLVAAETIDAMPGGPPALEDLPAAAGADTDLAHPDREAEEDAGILSPPATAATGHGLPAATTDHGRPAGDPGIAAGIDKPAGEPVPSSAAADMSAEVWDALTADPLAQPDQDSETAPPPTASADPVVLPSDPVASLPDLVAPLPDPVAVESIDAPPGVGEMPAAAAVRAQPAQRRPGAVTAWIWRHRRPAFALACAILAAAGVVPFLATGSAKSPSTAKPSTAARPPSAAGPLSYHSVRLDLPSNWRNVAVSSLAFSPSGATLAIPSQDICVWDIAAKGCITGFRTTAYSVAFSRDGKILAAGFAGTNYSEVTIRLWNVATRSQIATLTDPGSMGAYSVAFSPDGKLLAGGDGNGKAYLWNVATGKLAATLHDPSSKGIISVAFSPDGKLLAGGDNNGKAYLWNVATRSQIATLTDPGSMGAYSVAFSPDGKLLVAGDNNGKAYLWNVVTAKLAATLTDPSSAGVSSVACSPDDMTMAAGDNNGSTYVWNVVTEKLLATLRDPSAKEINSIAFSKNGKTLATGDQGGSVYLWRAS